MPKPVFNEARCKACELCAAACPQKIIVLGDKINAKGYRPAICIDESRCTGCLRCAKTCPDIVIEIHR